MPRRLRIRHPDDASIVLGIVDLPDAIQTPDQLHAYANRHRPALLEAWTKEHGEAGRSGAAGGGPVDSSPSPAPVKPKTFPCAVCQTVVTAAELPAHVRAHEVEIAALRDA